MRAVVSRGKPNGTIAFLTCPPCRELEKRIRDKEDAVIPHTAAIDFRSSCMRLMLR